MKRNPELRNVEVSSV